MSETFVINLGREALYTVLLVSAPVLGLGLAVGLAVSIFQATTQLQEQTLAFVPKIIAVFIALVIFGPWMLSVLMDFARGLLGNLHNFVQ
ncbi:MAG: flagellar biosynthesis protein FliQ [Firmicutes bacterium]|nr:flagellar biosynthesis protein FliQ [Bacillota bacterium]